MFKNIYLDTMMGMRRFYRDRWDKKISGVCGGLGPVFQLDPTVVRLLLLFLTIITGFLPVILLYLIAWIFIPWGPKTYIQYDCRRLYRSIRLRRVSGVCAGIAQFLKIDPLIVRGIFVVLLFLTAVIPLLVVYGIGSVIIPENPKEQP